MKNLAIVILLLVASVACAQDPFGAPSYFRMDGDTLKPKSGLYLPPLELYKNYTWTNAQTFNDTTYFKNYVRGIKLGSNPATIVGDAPYWFDNDLGVGLNTVNYPILEFDMSAYTLYVRNTSGNYGLELTGGTNPIIGSYASGYLTIRHRNTFYNGIRVYPNSTSNTDALEIDATGNVDVKVALEVNGTERINNGGYHLLPITADDNNAPPGSFFIFTDGGDPPVYELRYKDPDGLVYSVTVSAK